MTVMQPQSGNFSNETVSVDADVLRVEQLLDGTKKILSDVHVANEAQQEILNGHIESEVAGIEHAGMELLQELEAEEEDPTIN